MNLSTPVEVTPWDEPLDYHSAIALIGSCFTQHIGERFTAAGFDTAINPAGITFNPLSIADTLDSILSDAKMQASEWVERGGLYHHFDLHSSMSGAEHRAVVDEANAMRKHFKQKLQTASRLFITLGTAWVYRKAETGRVVNNCHAFPAQEFKKELISAEVIAARLGQSIERLQATFPQLNVVLTLSPVRHWKDGGVENAHSKAILRTAIGTLSQQFERLDYFPAYEIMMDELRDYRYYADDMLHPSSVAQEIIWQRLLKTATKQSTREIIDEVVQYKQMCAHRSRFPGSAADEQFRAQLHARKETLIDKYPEVKL